MKYMPRRGRVVAAASLVVLSLLASACGSSTSTAAKVKTVGTVTSSGISPERCAENRKAGSITYLTSFDYAASASILDVVVADAKGYFKAMCLDVKLQSGFSNDNVPIVSSGKVPFSSLGSMSEVAAAVDKKADLEAIGLYGHSAIEDLAASAKSNINSPAEVTGTTMGVLGSIPYSVRLMLTRAGVDLDKLKQVQVPFDATLLDKGDFQSRAVYKSAEPRQLDNAGIKYRLFDPNTFDIPASFGAMVVNKTWANAHPTSVEDFLRADLHGFQYALDHPDESVGYAFKKSDPKYYLTQDGENFRWKTEAALVRSSTPSSDSFGYMDGSQIKAETEPLHTELKQLANPVDTSKLYDDQFFKDIHSGSQLIWPAGEAQ